VRAAGAGAFIIEHSFGGAIALELARTGAPVGPLVVYEPPAAIGHLLAASDLAALTATDDPDEILDRGIQLLDRAGLVGGGGTRRSRMPTYHRWRNQFDGMKADDVKRLKELERVKRLKELERDDANAQADCGRHGA